MKKSDAEFIFSILIIISLFLGVIAFFCGEDIMKCACKKNYCLIFLFVTSLLFCLLLLMFLKCCFCEENKNQEKLTIINELPQNKNDLEKVTKLILTKKLCNLTEYKNLKNLETLEIVFDNYTIPTDVFSKCNKLETIILHHTPTNQNPISFTDYISLKELILCGKKSDWNNFNAILSADCDVKFKEYQKVKIIKVIEEE